MAKEKLIREATSLEADIQKILGEKQQAIAKVKLDIARDDKACLEQIKPIAQLIVAASGVPRMDIYQLEFLDAYTEDDKIAVAIGTKCHHTCEVGPKEALAILSKALPDCKEVTQLRLVPTVVPDRDGGAGRYLGPGHFVKHEKGFSIVANDAFEKVSKAAEMELQARNLCAKYGRVTLDEFKVVMKNHNVPEIAKRALELRTGQSRKR